MDLELRHFPRVACDHVGHLEVRFRDRGDYRRVLAAVTIRSLAPDGAGLVFRDPEGQSVPLSRDTPVTVRFHPADREIEIPGRVVWRREAGQDSPLDLGIRFQLELAPLDTRQAYARWIVGELAAAQRVQ
jgi:hypothetical protein